jgi:hypothetical protein
MIKKLLPIIVASLIFSACTSLSDLEMVVNPITGIESGAWQMALIVEAQTNFSSLLYDKTEADFESFTVHAIQVLPQDCFYYIMPTIYKGRDGKRYDESYSDIMASYLRLNGYGRPTATIDEADYIIMIEVAESAENYFGSNTSVISVTIMEQNESPVFYARAAVKSESDRNFHYYPTKGAKPVKYLTLKGFEKIFHEGLPQAFS